MNIKGPILCVAGFGDNSSMFAPLVDARRSGDPQILPLDLPGFGAEPLRETSIATLAQHLAAEARRFGARSVIAHSVASIIAAEAAHLSDSTIDTIVSLEGNLTAEDAYFSGTAADYDDAVSFRVAFLERLHEMAKPNRIIEGYAERVSRADPGALWSLGRDARQYSQTSHPGERLRSAGNVLYVLNPANCPENSLNWLKTSGLTKVELDGASHWPTIDQPSKVLLALRS
ncbi:alpha/beta fold hydrolase [Roseibium album]|uniref:Acetoin dehydrogenase E2 subunit dihydrolipoyllysine-residue acetyltransferase n=1 Tax=Roseibium album TaxID=311410 RepID=A0A0M6ZWL9_9HYPH|nr:alpha/beta hydrolase [Roseibium album]CTQ58681.1 acetoin dehydrogenase E2 subunit dihydrolipoyllysine-residue acetyltransferase [Roseibium album]CTQ67159.1 acetoin dehydrogenase E2 subunit dihydrolipoyllysine-residue acetyltransferase [Roseibium album]CTQ72256.1 acetoin dehydrogenase E2 subunit dihydrolipoyllysine-residue acetyltransferase [Roseibium album]